MIPEFKNIQHSKFSSENYRPEVDGLRALAVVPVILFHAGYDSFSGGYVGVDVFFVISGYLITKILINDIRTDQFSLKNFYERRARRILPALYVVCILTCLAAFTILLPSELVLFSKSVVSVPLFASNIIFYLESGYFGTAIDLKPLVHTWSLAVEEQFYIVYPFILFLIYRLTKYKLNYLVLGAAFFLSLYYSYYLTYENQDAAFYLPLTRAWELLLGCVVAFVLFQYPKRKLRRWVIEVLCIIALVSIIYPMISFDHKTLFPSWVAIFPVAGTGIILLYGNNSRITDILLSNKYMVSVGLISYSLYLIHQPMFVFSRYLGVFENNAMFLVATSFLLSAVSFKYIETPFRNKRMIGSNMLFGLLAGGTILLLCIGYIIYYNDGFPSRFDEHNKKIFNQYVTYPGYNQAYFNSLKHKEFSGDSRKKIIIIGDSYARDFTNVINEAGLSKNLDLSTFYISSDCGNLYLRDYSTIQNNISESRKNQCFNERLYYSATFENIANNADEIWLISSWVPWVIELLHQSIKNIHHDFSVTVRVFGIKHFGKINQRKILGIGAASRSLYGQEVSNEKFEINTRMMNVLAGYPYYYDIMSLSCGGDSRDCKIFDQNNLLISTDGGHLTKAGAAELGVRLHDILTEISKKNPTPFK